MKKKVIEEFAGDKRDAYLTEVVDDELATRICNDDI